MNISDSNETANKDAETTQTEGTSKPGTEPKLLANVDEISHSAIAGRSDAERAVVEREMLSGLQRATAAAERLTELSPEDEEPEPSTEREEEPPSGPKNTAPLPPPFAVTSNGQVLLNVEACSDLKLDGRTTFRGIVLSDEEAAYALRKIDDTIHDAAGHLGGMIKRRETKGRGGSDDK